MMNKSVLNLDYTPIQANHSLIEVDLHLVLVTKYRKPFPFVSFKCPSRVEWVGKICQSAHCKLLDIGFSENHWHLLISVGSVWPISKTVEIIKTLTSKAFKKKYGHFWSGWQCGYYICSVGKSSVSRVRKYLSNQ